MHTRTVAIALTFSLGSLFFAQEALKSTEEEYYDFLSLTGITERPTLGYRTLSDSEWNLKKTETPVLDADGNAVLDKNGNPLTETAAPEHVWQHNNLGSKRTLWQSQSEGENWFTRGIDHALRLKIYGPEWYNSYNTTAPYGQNDGALWQGKGYNTSLTSGARLEGFGFEVTVKPQVSFSQNRSFEYIQPNYSGETYADKADTYGYYGVPSIDAPQRFGDKAFWTFDWGDTEIRWAWKNLTVGFGTQTIWLGPAQLNPIIHSNNAASYPKLDIGLRKTKLTMPHFGWNLGYVEARGWWGYLSESEWFDNDASNDHNLITGLGVYYQFPFLREFTIGLNRTMLSKWDNKNAYTMFNIYLPVLSSGRSGGDDDSDQRISFTFDYKMANAGFEVYLEWARNDYSPLKDFYVRYPFHTQGWTFGAKKAFNLPWGLKGALQLELTYLECSADYDRLLEWYSTFYAHHRVTQGYTNGGQWLGAGIGTGGNSQYLGFTVYHPKGSITLFGQRRNPDLDYTMYIDSRNNAEDFTAGKWSAEHNIRTMLDFGVSGIYYALPNLQLKGKFVFEDEHNPLNVSKRNGESGHSQHRFNGVIQLGAKYLF